MYTEADFLVIKERCRHVQTGVDAETRTYDGLFTPGHSYLKMFHGHLHKAYSIPFEQIPLHINGRGPDGIWLYGVEIEALKYRLEVGV